MQLDLYCDTVAAFVRQMVNQANEPVRGSKWRVGRHEQVQWHETSQDRACHWGRVRKIGRPSLWSYFGR